MSNCHICGASETEAHFGGISCRACAAFFRRYFHSKKSVVSCTCKMRFKNSHPCRECRIQKCIEAGMIPEKVQHKREKHPKKRKQEKEEKENVEIIAMSPSDFLCSTPVSEVKLLLSISSIPFQIDPRDTSNISHAVSKWFHIQERRSKLYGKRLDETTYYEACQSTKTDCEIVWDLFEIIFPQLEMISKWDKEALLRNFHTKWALLVSAIDYHKNRKEYKAVNTIEDYSDMVIKFYLGSCYENSEMTRETVLNIFEPYIRYYAFVLAVPIFGKQFDPMEYMALAMIALFDGAHTNISVECSEFCHSMKNLVLRELRGYLSNMKCGGEMRFVETIDTLILMEKGEAKFMEELLLLEMHNVHIHDDYRLMIRERNY